MCVGETVLPTNSSGRAGFQRYQSFLFSREAQQVLVDIYALRSFHAQAKEKPGRAPMPTIKMMKPDPVAMEAQREEIKARYGQIFGT